MLAPPLKIPLKKAITLNNLVQAGFNNQKTELINHIIINGFWGSFSFLQQARGYSTEINRPFEDESRREKILYKRVI